MEKQPKPKSLLGKKRKRKLSATVAASEPKTIKVETAAKEKDVIVAVTPPTKKPKKKKVSISISEPDIKKNEEVTEPTPKKQNTGVQKTPLPDVMFKGLSMEEIGEKYPILINKELIDRFLKVPFSNNQKGRIRQAVKSQLQGSDDKFSADVINGKIQAILKSSENLTDSDLRRMRILYNMLKATVAPGKEVTVEKKKKKKKKVKEGTQKDEEGQKDKEVTENDTEDKKEQLGNKVKGPKRYVVFIGNLPLDVDKEKLMKHFADIDEHIKDIRIPKQAEGKKSAIAFIEVTNEPTFEMALSKHHSMLDNKRINVMYTTQQNSKVSKSEAKGKAAKLIALQKSGKLAGSTAVSKKRSHRRNIMKKARAKEEQET